MDRIAELIKDYLVPGSTMFLLAGLSAGVVLLYWDRASQRWGRLMLTALAAGYWLVATPAFSGVLERGLNPGHFPLASAREAGGAAAVVVLGGGSRTYATSDGEVHSLSRESAARVLEAVRLYRMLGDPLVITSGGDPDSVSSAPESAALAHALEDAGVPAARIVQESGSQSTREQAEVLGPVLADRGIDRFVLVTSADHMDRALRTFRKLGLTPVPSAPEPEDEVEARVVWLPTEGALGVSRTALREYLALVYYWVRGWLAAA